MQFKKFQIFRGSTLQQVTQYLFGPLANALRDLNAGLTNLSLVDNHAAFEEKTLVIANGTEVAIDNKLRDFGGNKLIPTKWIITNKVASGTSDIVRGSTAWTEDLLYLQNVGANSATVDVIFMK